MVDLNAMSDEALLTAFEECTLPMAAWTHRAHVRVAFLFASRFPAPESLDRIRTAIKTYNASRQIPESPDRGYHETITVVFMRLVHDAIRHTGPFVTSDVFCERHPELLEKSVLSRFYTKDRLRSPEAKRQFIEPDLAPLPELADALIEC
ncbi:MAG: hypothetical protein JSS02_02295 [Planctomycetes bacterium]|nr:hypothetical protein [Planctomycetota bacterium]